MENLQDDLSELLQAAGRDKVLTYENRVAAMQLVAAYEAFYKRKLSIDQFCNGLDVLGVLNLIRSHPESMQPYLIHNTYTLLTPALLFNQFHNIDKVEDGTREVTRQHLKRSICYGVPFPPKFNVQFHIVLCTIYPTFCLSFEFAVAIQLFCIQHSTLIYATFKF